MSLMGVWFRCGHPGCQDAVYLQVPQYTEQQLMSMSWACPLHSDGSEARVQFDQPAERNRAMSADQKPAPCWR